jgi:hypothetical protein
MKQFILILLVILLTACSAVRIDSTPIYSYAVPIPTATISPAATLAETSSNIGISAWERYRYIPDNYFDQEMSAQIYYNLTDSYIANAQVEFCFGGVCKVQLTGLDGKATVKLSAPEGGWEYENGDQVPWKVCVLNSTPRVCLNSYSIITWDGE